MDTHYILIIAILLVIVGLVGTAIGLGIGSLLQKYASRQWRISEQLRLLEKDKDDLTARVQQLEGEIKPWTRKEHTYSTIANYEDAMAYVNSIIWETETRMEYLRSSAKKLHEILGVGRKGPHAYPVDKPSEKGKNL